jgi:hypothetical protein
MNQKLYSDEMFEEAERKEAANKGLYKLYDELAEIERQELANKSFDALEELPKNQKIDLALEEIDYIVIGGQDGEEFYNSIQFIRKVLKSLK